MRQSDFACNAEANSFIPILYKLGLTPKYSGFHSTLIAVALIQDDSDRCQRMESESRVFAKSIPIPAVQGTL